jgi:MYND finger
MSGVFDWGDDSSDDDHDTDVNYDIKNCHHCSKINDDHGGKNKKCGQCKKVSYCSVECQRADWPKHKKACKALVKNKVPRRFVNLVDEYGQSDRFKQKVEEIKQMYGGDPEQLRDTGVDVNALSSADVLSTESGQFRLHELTATLYAREQMDIIFDKYYDSGPPKQTRKLLRAIHDNPDRRVLHYEIYRWISMIEERWNPCFATARAKEQFFGVLSIVMKNDCREFTSWSCCHDNGLADWPVSSGSNIIIPQIFFSPERKAYTTLPTTSTDYNSDASYRQLVDAFALSFQSPATPTEIEIDRISLYFKMCWKEHIDLALAMFTAYQKGTTSFMKTLKQHWKDTFLGLRMQGAAYMVFQSSMDRYKKPFHDPESPCLAPLIAMLNVRGPGIDQFKQWVYVSVALLLVQARFIADEKLVSARLLEKTLMTSLKKRSYSFFRKVAVKYAQEHGQIRADGLCTSPFDPLDEFMASHPEMKAML